MPKNLSDFVSAKKTAQNRLLTLCAPITQGFFRDESWEAVSQLFRAIRAMGGEVEVNSTAYYSRPNSDKFNDGKRWNLTITANGFTFPAVLTADFGASEVGKTDVYDLTLTV